MNGGNARQSGCFGVAAKGSGSARHWGFAEERSQDERFGQVDGFVHAVVFDALSGLFIEKVEAKRVFISLDLAQETFTQEHPFLLTDLTLEDGFLHARAVVLAGLGHAAEPTQAGLLDRGDVVGDEDQHGRRG